MPENEEEEKRNPPAASEVMTRALILLHLFVKAAVTPPPDLLSKWMESWSEEDCSKCIASLKEKFEVHEKKVRDAGLWDSMDEGEREFMQIGPLETTARHQIDASWSVEAIACLRWAVGKLERLPAWDQQADPRTAGFQKGERAKDLIEAATLRQAAEIEKMRESAEAWHWRCRTRALLESGRIPPVLENGATMDQVIEMSANFSVENGSFDKTIGNDYPAFGKAFREITEEEFLTVRSISQERHKALNWLCGYAPGNRWAETPTDT
jgi:hypothetical protein